MEELVRKAAVAGTFYPGTREELDRVLDALLAEAALRCPTADACPKAIVAPHAGYVYSGPVAASAFARFAPFASAIERVVVIGPAHRVHVEGVVSPGAAKLETPLGTLEVDVAALSRAPDVAADARAHAREHSVEVELPFVQKVAPRAKVVPLAVGHARADDVARTLEALWGGPETVVVVSSDLSHYLPYEMGQELDRATVARILSFDARISGEEACGAAGINGLLRVAQAKHMRAELVDLRSSGDTAGTRDEVVGYGAFAFYERVYGGGS
jgi:AmmeMemoRadiSam system protein B